jgi:hypothetical protein
MMGKLEKQQACQLFIEQEIEKGLKDGKTKYAIGKEVVKLIKKFFEADVKPNTVSKRAQRMAKAIGTNVPNESTSQNNSEKKEGPVGPETPTPQQIVADMKAGLEKDLGGKFTKPKWIKGRGTPQSRVGLFTADQAVRRLESIPKNDLEWEAALDFMQAWLWKHMADEKPAKQDSDNLSRLKTVWERTNKTDREAFLRWIEVGDHR